MKQLILILVLFALCSGLAFSQIPRTLSYQGVLTDTSGTPRADASYNFTFSLYDSGSGGTHLWSEQKSLLVKRGLFSTALGDATPFPDSLKFDRPYYLNISVSEIGELSPRIPLTSVGYSMNALRADTAKVAQQNSGIINNSLLVTGSDLRLGTNDGRSVGNKTDQRALVHMGNGIIDDLLYINYNGDFEGGIVLAGQGRVYIDGSDLSIGTSDGRTVGNKPKQRALVHEIDDQLFINYDGDFEGGTVIQGPSLTVSGSDFVLGTNDGRPFGTKNGQRALVHSVNDELILNYDGDFEGGTVVEGPILKVKVLEITGGSDLAEPFPVSEENQLEEGSVVVIDESIPGHVTLSTKRYDKKVAGVVSGAGGIKPGLTLKQEGLMEGDQNIALSGRVYVKATASNGPIKPGDRLVTSSLPGCCMKMTDEKESNGAIIGKAMSSLDHGEGLVLVLVNLQ